MKSRSALGFWRHFNYETFLHSSWHNKMKHVIISFANARGFWVMTAFHKLLCDWASFRIYEAKLDCLSMKLNLILVHKLLKKISGNF